MFLNVMSIVLIRASSSKRQSYAVQNAMLRSRYAAAVFISYNPRYPITQFVDPKTPNKKKSQTHTHSPSSFLPLNTLPLRKNTPPRAPVCQYQSPPRSLLANLNHRFPRSPIRLARRGDMFIFPRESDNLSARRLNRQFRRLARRTATRRPGRCLRWVGVV
jgi:hypothetical protein